MDARSAGRVGDLPELLVDAQQARPRDLSTLRAGIIAAGAASATPLVYRARKVLAPLRHLTAYGMTEVGATISLSHLDSTEEQACEASGLPCEGFEVRVIDPDTGQDQPHGTPGVDLPRRAPSSRRRLPRPCGSVRWRWSSSTPCRVPPSLRTS